MTNLEWLRTLSAKELAKLLIDNCCMCSYMESDCYMNCESGHITWLNEEHVPKIKPCPCCGGKAKLKTAIKGNNEEVGYIYCCKCNIETPVGKKSDVVYIWNRRVDEEQKGVTNNET